VSRIKNISRAGWLIAGAVAALVLVPTVAVATASVVTLQGSPSGKKTNVTGAGQMLTATASPASFFQNASSAFGSTTREPVATPPAGLALVVTTIHVDVYYDPSPGSGQEIEFNVETGTSCTGSQVGSYWESLNPPSVQEIDIPLEPGLGIPSGDSLCGITVGSVDTEASVSGYTVPPGTVTSGPLHRVSAPPGQR
jgi:hypothetical protein